ncbi:PEP-CTERM sorting domain-containing protein [Aureliella helgolandensis]|nr:PEP-CTERM sorting domain-containing protein [Aureliella helgolandensis]
MVLSKPLFVFAVSFSAVALMSHSAAADYTYGIDLQQIGAPEVDGAVSIELLLREIDDGLGTGSDVALANGSGVFGFGIRLERTSGDARLNSFRIADGFSFFGVNPSPNPIENEFLWELNVTSSNPFAASPGFGTKLASFSLGTVKITPGEEDSIFTVGNLTKPLPNNLSLGKDLLSQRADRVSDYGQLTVTGVPEPSSSWLILLGASVFLGRRRSGNRIG